MCVSMYMCVCVCTHALMHMSINACMHVRMCVSDMNVLLVKHVHPLWSVAIPTQLVADNSSFLLEQGVCRIFI